MTSFFPELSASTQAFVRAGYGVLMLATLLQAVPEARRFFLSERWGGYAKSSTNVDAVHNPVVMPIVVALWLAAALAIAAGWRSPWPALINLAFCRYFFIHMRWKGVLRGMGAPGFLAYWLGLVVFLLEYTTRYAPQLRSLALLVAQADLGFIMLSAGIYKVTAGYPRNQGMELGLCNPMWGYWWTFYRRQSPDSVVFWTMNQLAWGTEIVGALMMLFPPTRALGGLVITVSFIYILTQIRLGFLCEMVALAGLLYLNPGGMVDGWIAGLTGPVATPAPVAGEPARVAGTLLRVALWSYLAALPIVYSGLYYNFYARRPLPGILQRILDGYANLFGVVIWRVFSVDLVNFFIRVVREPRAGGTRNPVAHLGSWPRFNHVGEMICITSLFTSLKYYPSNDAIFKERLLRYARTIPRERDDLLVFEYVSVIKRDRNFDWRPVAEYRVDVDAGTIEERVLDESFSARAAHAVSPVHEGLVPGSYAPARR